MTPARRQELVNLLSGTAHVLSGCALDFETRARGVADLGAQFPPRLRRDADYAVVLSRALRTIAARLQIAPLERDGGPR